MKSVYDDLTAKLFNISIAASVSGGFFIVVSLNIAPMFFRHKVITCTINAEFQECDKTWDMRLSRV